MSDSLTAPAPGTSIQQREKPADDIRREADAKGMVSGGGVRPAGAPFPVASPETGYYGMPLLKEPQWKWEIPSISSSAARRERRR